jgi:hypothetical protein
MKKIAFSAFPHTDIPILCCRLRPNLLNAGMRSGFNLSANLKKEAEKTNSDSKGKTQ